MIDIKGDRGQVTAFVVGVLLGLWLFTGLVVDGGLALAAKVRAMDTAQEAARTGAQQLDIDALREHQTYRLDTQRATSAARSHVAATGNTARVTVDGDTVTVHVTHHVRTQILQLAGLNEITVAATGTAHARTGTAQHAQNEGGGAR
ncbi:pilus assembly protein TadG-related protein [Streptomyces sp. 4N509B]|uniref:pilus assembly protein TadG-related protein n=1 Tax=Streptomyces sp. 4N509B TaxID=3457413 RepID=UPI003FD24F82